MYNSKVNSTDKDQAFPFSNYRSLWRIGNAFLEHLSCKGKILSRNDFSLRIESVELTFQAWAMIVSLPSLIIYCSWLNWGAVSVVRWILRGQEGEVLTMGKWRPRLRHVCAPNSCNCKKWSLRRESCSDENDFSKACKVKHCAETELVFNPECVLQMF